MRIRVGDESGVTMDGTGFASSDYCIMSIYIELDGTWRVIAPTELGPQPYNPGGEMILWTSRDQGATWTREKQLTQTVSATIRTPAGR